MWLPKYLHRQASQSFWNILPGASKFPGLLSLSPSLPPRGPIYNSSYIHNLSELRHPLENYWAVEKLPSWPLCSNSRLHINTQVTLFFNIYVLGWAGSQLWHVGSSLFLRHVGSWALVLLLLFVIFIYSYIY